MGHTSEGLKQYLKKLNPTLHGTHTSIWILERNLRYKDEIAKGKRQDGPKPHSQEISRRQMPNPKKGMSKKG